MADSIIITSGVDQNSYVSLDEANAILLTCAASFMEIGDQLTEMDAPYLIEAASDLDTLWTYNGDLTDNGQEMQWPRRWVMKPGYRLPREPGWCEPCTGDDWLRFKIDFLMPGQTGIPFLDDNTVPKQVKKAQALIAMLRKNSGNLVGDSQGDTNGLQLDVGFKIAYVNAIRNAADIHKLLADLGTFIGDGIMRTPNA